MPQPRIIYLVTTDWSPNLPEHDVGSTCSGQETERAIELACETVGAEASDDSSDKSTSDADGKDSPDSDVTGATTNVDLSVEGATVTMDRLAEMATDAGVTVVDRNPDRANGAASKPTEGGSPTPRNAIETAALQSFQQRQGRETTPSVQPTVGGESQDGSDEDEEPPDQTTDEWTEPFDTRDGIEATQLELSDEIREIKGRLKTADEAIATAVTEREQATEAFLPEDKIPEFVDTETRDAIESHLETLAEKRDARSERATIQTERLKTQTARAASARDAIEETAAVVYSLEERTDADTSEVDNARYELAEARAARDESDEAVARLQSDIGRLTSEVDSLRTKIREGETCLQTFDALSHLRTRREQIIDELSDLETEHEETKVELAALETETEDHTDDC